MRLAVAVSTRGDAAGAARAAAAEARVRLGVDAALALVFAAPSYADLDAVPRAVEAELGPVPLAGGTSGGAVFDDHRLVRRGVLVALLGGDVRATVTAAPIGDPALLEVVPAGGRLLEAADGAARSGFEDGLCLAFAPAVRVDGDALVAAVRKGTGARMQLAGGITGDDFTFDRARVFAEGGARDDRAVLAGLFSRTRVGLAARHGLTVAGPARRVTRCEGGWLAELDGRPALDVWTDDVRAAGGHPPPFSAELRLYLATSYALGQSVAGLDEPVVRVPMEIRPDGAARAGALAEGAVVQVMSSDPRAMRLASARAAALAAERAGGKTTGGLVFSCSGRLSVLGGGLETEAREVARRLGGPIGGVCVFGEVARAHHEADAFHNTTAVVVALR